MQRTIEMRYGALYYKGKRIAITSSDLDGHFKLRCNGKYKITITERGAYRFKKNSTLYEIFQDTIDAGFVCCRRFHKLFFKPNCCKTYSIKVKRIK